MREVNCSLCGKECKSSNSENKAALTACSSFAFEFVSLIGFNYQISIGAPAYLYNNPFGSLVSPISITSASLHCCTSCQENIQVSHLKSENERHQKDKKISNVFFVLFLLFIIVAVASHYIRVTNMDDSLDYLKWYTVITVPASALSAFAWLIGRFGNVTDGTPAESRIRLSLLGSNQVKTDHHHDSG